MAAGAGAAVSTTAVGYLAQILGYAIGFYAIAAVGLTGLGILWLLMPETGERLDQGPSAPPTRPLFAIDGDRHKHEKEKDSPTGPR